jgi:hypothetical protein
MNIKTFIILNIAGSICIAFIIWQRSQDKPLPELPSAPPNGDVWSDKDRNVFTRIDGHTLKLDGAFPESEDLMPGVATETQGRPITHDPRPSITLTIPPDHPEQLHELLKNIEMKTWSNINDDQHQALARQISINDKTGK